MLISGPRLPHPGLEQRAADGPGVAPGATAAAPAAVQLEPLEPLGPAGPGESGREVVKSGRKSSDFSLFVQC